MKLARIVMGATILAGLAFAAAPAAAQTTVTQEGPMGFGTMVAKNLDDVVNNGYQVIDVVPNPIIRKSTDGDYGIKVKGATLNALGNGGNTTFGTRAIPNALCLKGRDWACDGEVIVAITTGAGQSNVYLGDVDARQKYTDTSTITSTYTGRFFLLAPWTRTNVTVRVLK